MKILLLSGVSGAGKTHIATELATDINFFLIKSFTDRPCRNGEKNNDHVFISTALIKFMLTYNIVASTKIDGHYYCTTFSQFDDKKINVYVVDKKGIDDVKISFKDAQIVSILINKNNINIDQSRKDRNIVIPTVEDVDFVFENNSNVIDTVEQIKKTILPIFGVEYVSN